MWYQFRVTAEKQFKHIEYLWFRDEPSEKTLEQYRFEIRDDAISRFFPDAIMPRCESSPVPELPPEVRKEMIREYKAKLSGAQYMLKVLGADE